MTSRSDFVILFFFPPPNSNEYLIASTYELPVVKTMTKNEAPHLQSCCFTFDPLFKNTQMNFCSSVTDKHWKKMLNPQRTFTAFITKASGGQTWLCLTHDACMCVCFHTQSGVSHFLEPTPNSCDIGSLQQQLSAGRCGRGSGPLLGNIEIKRWCCWLVWSGDIIAQRRFFIHFEKLTMSLASQANGQSCWNVCFDFGQQDRLKQNRSRKLCSPCRHFIWYQRSVELAF